MGSRLGNKSQGLTESSDRASGRRSVGPRLPWEMAMMLGPLEVSSCTKKADHTGPQEGHRRPQIYSPARTLCVSEELPSVFPFSGLWCWVSHQPLLNPFSLHFSVPKEQAHLFSHFGIISIVWIRILRLWETE